MYRKRTNPLAPGKMEAHLRQMIKENNPSLPQSPYDADLIQRGPTSIKGVVLRKRNDPISPSKLSAILRKSRMEKMAALSRSPPRGDRSKRSYSSIYQKEADVPVASKPTTQIPINVPNQNGPSTSADAKRPRGNDDAWPITCPEEVPANEWAKPKVGLSLPVLLGPNDIGAGAKPIRMSLENFKL